MSAAYYSIEIIIITIIIMVNLAQRIQSLDFTFGNNIINTQVD